MKKLAFALVAAATLLAIPTATRATDAAVKPGVTTTQDAAVDVSSRHRRHWRRHHHYRHYGWRRGHHYGWYKHRHHRWYGHRHRSPRVVLYY
jgi:hypothetical protein